MCARNILRNAEIPTGTHRAPVEHARAEGTHFMKIIKRNGSEVAFDITKISNAIRAANKEVPEDDRLTERQVVYASENVADRCEAAGHTVTVEEIQDMVEDEIMALDRYEVARKYIIYRYVQSL